MIRGQKNSSPKLTVPIEAKLHNRFDFEVVDSVTGEVKQKAYAENIILASWWARVFAPAVANDSIHVGTGSGTLSAARTSLFTFLAGKTSQLSVNVVNEVERWVSHKRVATWLENENVNTVWTEVGVAYGNTSTNLTTHALIKDLNGNPVSIHKGTTDIINVYSTVYVYVPEDTDSIRLGIPRRWAIADGSLLDWLLGASSGYNPYFLALKGNILGINTGHEYKAYPASSTAEYDIAYNVDPVGATRTMSVATKTMTINLPRLAASSIYNSNQGIKSILITSNSNVPETFIDLQLNIPGVWFPHSEILAETVGTGDGATLGFNTQFPFLKDDGSFVLKKNGAVVDPADYVVSYGEPNGSDLIHHLKVLDYYQNSWELGTTSNNNIPLEAYIIFENPWYQKFGMSSWGVTPLVTAECSNDSPTGPWTTAGVFNSYVAGANDIPVAYQNYRYWRIKPSGTGVRINAISILSTALTNSKNINFVAGKAPAVGDVITADYRCEVVAKTVNNVFDLSVSITLQEKVV